MNYEILFQNELEDTNLINSISDYPILDTYILDFITEAKLAVRYPKICKNDYKLLPAFIQDIKLTNKILDFSHTAIVQKCNQLSFVQVITLKSMLRTLILLQNSGKPHKVIPGFRTAMVSFLHYLLQKFQVKRS